MFVLFLWFDNYFPTSSTPFGSSIVLRSQEKRFVSLIDGLIIKRLLGTDLAKELTFQSCFLHLSFHKKEFLSKKLMKTWIRLILLKEISEFTLNLEIMEDGIRLYYDMPSDLIFGGWLTSLTLKGCKIADLSIIAPNLESLVLEDCRFERDTYIRTMLINNRRLKLLKLSCVENVSELSVSNMPALTELACVSCDVHSVHIDAPKLLKFTFSRSTSNWSVVTFHLKCKSLEEIKLIGATFDDVFSAQNIIKHLPKLKTMRLKSCIGFRVPNLSSTSRLQIVEESET